MKISNDNATIKKIQKAAETGNSTKCFLVEEAKKRAFADLRDWKYDTMTETFSKRVSLWNVQENFKYYKITTAESGLMVDIYREYNDGILYAKVSISGTAQNSESKEILKQLENLRFELYKKWLKRASEIAKIYFQKTKDEFLMFPEAYSMTGFRSVPYVTWNCKGKQDKAMVQRLGCLSNSSEEILKEGSYVPSFWTKEHKLQFEVALLNGCKMHVSRHYEPDYTFNVKWSDVSVVFEKREAMEDETDWEAGFKTIQMNRKRKAESSYKEFQSDLEEAEWFLEDGKPVAYIPVWHEEFATLIVMQAMVEYKDMFDFSLQKRDIPYLDREEKQCVRVMLKSDI